MTDEDGTEERPTIPTHAILYPDDEELPIVPERVSREWLEFNIQHDSANNEWYGENTIEEPQSIGVSAEEWSTIMGLKKATGRHVNKSQVVRNCIAVGAWNLHRRLAGFRGSTEFYQSLSRINSQPLDQFSMSHPLPEMAKPVKWLTVRMKGGLIHFVEREVQEYLYSANKTDIYRLCIRNSIFRARTISSAEKLKYEQYVRTLFANLRQWEVLFTNLGRVYHPEIVAYRQEQDEQR